MSANNEKSRGLGPLKGVVLAFGFVLMVLEIASTPVLAPYFGNTVFIWAAIISIFMLGLSLGYFLGGRAASNGRSLKSLSGLLAAAGAWLLLVGFSGSKTLAVLTPLNFSPYPAFLLLLAAAGDREKRGFYRRHPQMTADGKKIQRD